MSSVLHRTITPQSVFLIVLGHIALSLAAGCLFFLFHHVTGIRGICGALGFLSALAGGGVALWSSFRIRAGFCFGAAILSLLPLALWSWVVYEMLHSSNA